MLSWYLALIGGIFLAWFLIVTLFAPGIDYEVRRRLDCGSPEFLRTLRSITQTAVHSDSCVEILTNAAQFYPAMLDAIREARTSVSMECYIFNDDEIGGQFMEAMMERARAGVTVTLVVDAVGSFRLSRARLRQLQEAGVRAEVYQRFKWYAIARLNNRTHRELLIVDGRVAFMGGAGVGDQWVKGERGKRPWRDTMARITGPVAVVIQGVFAENWVECCGEILTGDEFFPQTAATGDTTAVVVKSSPADRTTAARVVFQMLIDGATKSIRINTPYFLPDRALRASFVAAALRGVAIEIIVPGSDTDQRWVRIVSRRRYRQLLKAGIRIYEYRVGMTHAKVLNVDDSWVVLGTTNFDNRSFEHNDEVNVAIRDHAVSARLKEDFQKDLQHCEEVTIEHWKRRSWLERVVEPVAWILERQQ